MAEVVAELISSQKTLQFTEELRSQSPNSTPTLKFIGSPETLGTFLTKTIEICCRQLSFYQVQALRYMYLREYKQEQIISYAPQSQVEYQTNLLLQSHYSLKMRDSALAIAIPMLLRTMKCNEPKHDFAIKVAVILHISDKYEPACAATKLDQKIDRLFGSSRSKLSKGEFVRKEEEILEEIDYEVNYITSFSYV